MYSEYTISNKIKEIVSVCGCENRNEKIQIIDKKLREYCCVSGFQDEQHLNQMLRTIGAKYFLWKVEQCNNKGIVYHKLKEVLDEKLIKQISLVAGETLFIGDFYFCREYLLEEMLKRKSVIQNSESFFARTSSFTERDVAQTRRQEGIITLLKQFVIVEEGIYQTSVADAKQTVSLAQLYLMINYASCNLNIGQFREKENHIPFQKRIREVDTSICDKRNDLTTACIRMGLYETLSIKSFMKSMLYGLIYEKIIYMENLKAKEKLQAFILLLFLINVCIIMPKLIPIVIGLMLGYIVFKWFSNNFLLMMEFLVYKFIDWIVELWKK